MKHLDKDTLFEQIINDEGKVTNDSGNHVIYKDHLGYWTLGYGKLVDPEVNGAGISESEARVLLESTLQTMWDELAGSLSWIYDKPMYVQIALLNMCYNLGLPRLLQFQKMLAAIEDDNGEEAYAQALDSKWARQVGQRAQRIADVFRDEL